MRRPLQGGKEVHEAERSDDDGGVPASQGGKELHAAQRSEEDGGVPILLALALACLIVYASLYPFSEWRNQGISPFAFLSAPLPKYWTGFDVSINLLGYAPLGFLLVLSVMRSRRVPWVVSAAVLGAGLLSLCMETLQGFLPSRVPSNVDLALNTLGAWLGACCALALVRSGLVDRWGRLRARWFSADARSVLVLLLLWPLALLFPAAVPMGLGQVFERLELAAAEALANSPLLEWLPVREVELQPLVPLAELVCVALGALIPCLLGYCVIRALSQRAVFAIAAVAIGLGTSALSAALSYGPEHAWAWFDTPVQAGVSLAVLLAMLLLVVPRKAAAALALLALVIHLSLLNQAPAGPYFAQTLQIWEQGRFIKFYGLVQWLGWLWPYAALGCLVARLSASEQTLAGEK